MISFSVLGSGSKGNSVLVNIDGLDILLDAGLSFKELGKRLRAAGRSIDNIQYVFCSHKHGDHVKAIPMIQKKTFVNVFSNDFPGVGSLNHGVSVSLHRNGCIPMATITPIKMDHDTEAYGFIVQDNSGNKLGYITDTGSIFCDSLGYMLDCNALIVEFNHDLAMYDDCPYPDSVKERAIETHMDNKRAGTLLSLVGWKGLSHVVCHHISEKNNQHALVEYEAKRGLEEACCNAEIVIATQGQPTKVIALI